MVPAQDVTSPAASASPRNFFGSATHRVTERHQVSIPRHMLKTLSEAREGQCFLVWWNNEGFLRLYTEVRFSEKVRAIYNMPGVSRRLAAQVAGELSASAHPVEPDNQGRIVLKADWAEALSLKPELTFQGRFSHIELAPTVQVERPAVPPQDPALAEMRLQVTDILNEP